MIINKYSFTHHCDAEYSDEKYLSKRSLHVITGSHVGDGSVDGDGSHPEAAQHLAEPHSVAVAAKMLRSSLQVEQENGD